MYPEKHNTGSPEDDFHCLGGSMIKGTDTLD